MTVMMRGKARYVRDIAIVTSRALTPRVTANSLRERRKANERARGDEKRAAEGALSSLSPPHVDHPSPRRITVIAA